MSDETKATENASTTINLEVTSAYSSSRTFTREGQKVEVPYLKLRGRDDEDGYIEVTAWENVALALKRDVANIRGQDGTIEKSRHVFMVTFATKKGTKDGVDVVRHDMISYTPISGPSVELYRERKAGRRALRAAALGLKSGNIEDAYRELEDYVARFTGMPAPSIDKGFSFEEPSAGPEEEAIARLAERSGNAPAPSPVQASAAPVQEAAAGAADDQVFGEEPSKPEVTTQAAGEPTPVNPVGGRRMAPPRPTPLPGRDAAPAPAADPAPAAAPPPAASAPAPRPGGLRRMGAMRPAAMPGM